ncbi:MAG: prepilin-type N-terminal cleavage/methylation domain-containing protein, partial [Clostridia bacterium]|nr:prepilin-type N-terminal cleavage/methylation domain-containing protein [Clostridia bacterium]
MKTNMKKKGFTLVELLVVIAIIAILATVSVVGYTAFIDKANESNDRSLVTQLNTSTTQIEGKYESMHEVADVLAANGFDIAKIKSMLWGVPVVAQ